MSLMFHYDVDPEEDAIIQAGFGGWVPCGTGSGGGFLESVRDGAREKGCTRGLSFGGSTPEEAQSRLPSSLELGLFVGDRGSVLKNTGGVLGVCARKHW